MFGVKKKIKYKKITDKHTVRIDDLEEGANFTKEFIVYKDEELLKVYSRKCDHNGGKLCKLEGKVKCPLHGWEFNPETGAYSNIQISKREEDFKVEGDMLVIPAIKEVLELPQTNQDYEINVSLLSHACILFETKEFSFATDPWIEGFAFSSGWWPAQLPPQNWVQKLNDVNFIYISHNHPDHLNQFTLEKIRKDMHFIVPGFQNDSVKKLLNRFGFKNVSSFDLQSYYRFKETDLYFSILKSGDFREDSGFYFTFGNFSCLSTVDSNDLNFLRFPNQPSLYCSSFAGGASGYPFCFNTIDENEKPKIIKRNTSAIKSTVKAQIKNCNPNYFLPYAGFFSERAPRDSYIKKLNKKNSTSDYTHLLKNEKVEVLDPLINDRYSFNGDKVAKAEKIERDCSFSEDPIQFYEQVFSKKKIDKKKIINFFKKSGFKDDLKVYFELTNSDFSKTEDYLFIDFQKNIEASFDPFNWAEIKELLFEECKTRHLNIKVRKDSFLWVIENNMPFEDLLIGFQCRIDRVPNIYNVKFWDHFTNKYI